jgi:hypothetical protein
MSSSNNTDGFMSLLGAGFAAAGATPLPFRDLIAKSYLQRGEKVPRITLLEGMKASVKAVPFFGTIVGGQLFFSRWLDNQWVNRGFVQDPKKFHPITSLGTPAIVGFVTAPVLAVINGLTNGLTITKSFAQLRGRAGFILCSVIAVQETAFVAGLQAGEQINKLGNNPLVGYAGAFATGALGSLAGHPCNTLLTRWQKNLPFSYKQSYWGAVTKARAIGFFALIMKCEKDAYNYFMEKKHHQ